MNRRFGVSPSIAVTLGIGAVVAMWLLWLGRHDYPNLHSILDAGACLLAGILALLLWDIGQRTRQTWSVWLAVSFTVAFLAELIHTSVTVEWFGSLSAIAAAQSTLRPATWPIAAYVLPIGAWVAIWFPHSGRDRTLVFLLLLLALSAALFPVFFHFPRYTLPIGPGVTRPLLLGVPVLWAGVALSCWRHRKADQLYPMLALTSVVMIVAHLAMLYSQAPHDTQAMVAHVGKFIGFLALMLMLMQAAAAAMSERIRAEAALATLNAALEQRVAERTGELRVAYEGTRAIIDTALDGVIVMDEHGLIEQFNAAAEGIFGLSREDAVGRALADQIIPAAARDSHRAGLARYLATGKAAILGRRIEVEGQRADGTLIPLELSISRMPGAQGATFAGFVRDLTARRQGELRVATQLARLDLLNHIARAIGDRQDLHSILQVVVRSLEEDLPVDFSCACLYDATAATLTISNVGVHGLSLALQMGMSERAQVPIDENGLSRCVAGSLVYEPDVAQVAFPFPQRLALAGLHSLVAAPLLVESRVFGVLIVARKTREAFSSADCEFLRQLSEQVALAAHQAETHAALQRAYDDLRQTQQAVMQQERLRALGQMASGIAHDINNAISPVMLYAEMLLERETDLSQPVRERLQIIQRAIGDVEHTVSRMREFYRQGEPMQAMQSVRLNDIAQQVLDLTRARWSDMPQQRGIVIETRVETQPDLPSISGIEAEIREALTNLIFNAVDAMPEGGVLGVHTGFSGDQEGVCIAISDTGVGMDEDTRRRCLEPFFTTKGQRGTGLGLAMVYGVAQRHGADVVIASAVGNGTTVRLIFPTPRVPVAGTPAVEENRIPTRLSILVVDDDPMLLRSLRDTLEADGHSITTANGGQEGIDIFCAAHSGPTPFAVVITDLGMPHVDGRRVARSIKAASSRTPVIMLTGWGQRLLAEGDIPAHVDLVLSKPPKLRTLREALARCCQPDGVHAAPAPSD